MSDLTFKKLSILRESCCSEPPACFLASASKTDERKRDKAEEEG